MKLQILSLLFGITGICRAQEQFSGGTLPDTGELKREGVDTIGIYSSAYAPGYYFPKVATDFANAVFESKILFWRKNGKDFFYYTNRKVYYPVHEFSGASIWNFYKANDMVIDTEVFRKTLLKSINMDTEQLTFYTPKELMPSFQRIELNINGKKVIKTFDYSEFEQFDRSGAENISYEYNLHTKTARFEQLIEQLFLKELKDQRPVKKDQN
jgi:hypothetical protein